jgi:hypothetical protein
MLRSLFHCTLSFCSPNLFLFYCSLFLFLNLLLSVSYPLSLTFCVLLFVPSSYVLLYISFYVSQVLFSFSLVFPISRIISSEANHLKQFSSSCRTDVPSPAGRVRDRKKRVDVHLLMHWFPFGPQLFTYLLMSSFCAPSNFYRLTLFIVPNPLPLGCNFLSVPRISNHTGLCEHRQSYFGPRSKS